MNGKQARAAVAEFRGRQPEDYTAHRAPEDSIHAGVWYVQERNSSEMLIDDQVWVVLPDGAVTRAIPVGNPIHPPSEIPGLP